MKSQWSTELTEIRAIQSFIQNPVKYWSCNFLSKGITAESRQLLLQDTQYVSICLWKSGVFLNLASPEFDRKCFCADVYRAQQTITIKKMLQANKAILLNVPTVEKVALRLFNQ